jgi:tRNA 2-selenouridine synthase
MNREDTADYRSLFLRDTPLLDTRSPGEFSKGAFPAAVNLPLMTDEERHQVGICYKRHGQSAAIELGHRLVAGDVRARRIEGWCKFARENPDGYLYCFRGGLRSATVREWLREAGIEYPLVRGGYKAMRRFLLESLEFSIDSASLLLIAGKTGTGKTRVIDAVPGSIDLEGLAKHRGSSFGRLLDEQPSQIDFENALAIALIRLLDSERRTVLLEDEGRLIGRISLPASLREKMQQAPLLVVEEPLVSRVDVIMEDYITDLGAQYRARCGTEGDLRHRQHLREGLARIKKRLGGALHAEIDQLLCQAFASAQPETAERLHRQWIELLLVKYYDPMYEYQMGKREGRVIARGTRTEIIERAGEANGQ